MAFLLLIGLTASAQANNDPLAKYRKKLMTRSIADYAKKVTIQDDDLSTVVVFSTIKAGRTKGHIPMGEGDIYLIAGVGKQTGRTVYQIAAAIGYWGNWRNYSYATYSSPDGPVNVSPTIAGRNVEVCMSAAGCKLDEQLSITMDENLLRSIAGTEVPWRFRFSGAGPDWNEEINPAEVGALLAAVDRYKTAHGLS